MALAYGSPVTMEYDEHAVKAPLDSEFAEVMSQLLRGSADPKSAVGMLETMCQQRAQALRDETAQHVHRPAHLMHLKSLAAEMDAQAATWHLIWCLYCNEGAAAGTGGPEVLDADDKRTFRQLLADKVSADPLLSRLANVVAWLESSADDALSRGPAPRFADKEATWLETQHRSGQGGVISELDPDAPGRQGKGLQPDNAKAEERLMVRLWQLIRSGHLQEARALCRQVGQPWRSTSLGGGGPYGPLPVGVAAAGLDEDLSEVQQGEDLAWEVDLGAGTMRALWKWACLQVSEQAMRSLGGGRYEAAVYGVLSGNLAAVLPVCSTWEDACWAYCRAWLDLNTDQNLSVERLPGQDLVGGDVIMSVLQRCNLAGGSAAAAADTGMAVVSSGHWPPGPLLQQPGSLAPLPQSFELVFEVLASSPDPAISGAARDVMHEVQQHLIRDSISALAGHLYRWQVTREVGGGGSGAEADEGASALGLPPSSARSAAFASHLLLALESLGVVSRCSSDHYERSRISSLSEQVVAVHVASLLERRQALLVPQYLCHLSDSLRSILAHELLQQLTDRLVGREGEEGAAGAGRAQEQGDSECLAVYCRMADWFSLCVERQEGQAEAAPSHLTTSIRPDEARHQLTLFSDKCRFSPALGPLHRAKAARWLFYPFVRQQAQLQQQQAAGALLPEPWVYSDALEQAVALSCELSLGDSTTAEAAHHLFEHVIPADFQASAAEYIEGLQQRAATAAAAAAAQECIEEQGGGGGLVVGAAAAAVEATAAASAAEHLGVLVSELSQWRLYFDLDKALGTWQLQYKQCKAAREQGPGPGPGLGAETLRQCGREIMDQVVSQLLQSDWLQGLHDVAEAAAEEAQEVQLALTCSSAGSNGAGAAPWGSRGCLFPTLKGAALFEVEVAVRAALQHAASSLGPGLSVEVLAPSEAEGHVLVSISAVPMFQAWMSCVELVVGLLQGQLPGLPQDLLLVNMKAGRAASAAICRRCALGQMVMRSFRVRQALVELGDDGGAGAELVELVAGAHIGQDPAAPPLLEVLSAQMLQDLLQLEAATEIALMKQQQQTS
mmetsp:Transcript_33440/g.73943  ORF Transcript_33440/g.73943 Transcript_33440/m.73943 type:complete len:1069 (+) Transcript_33440:427-3633(+)